jgi:hypothetical protein
MKCHDGKPANLAANKIAKIMHETIIRYCDRGGVKFPAI